MLDGVVKSLNLIKTMTKKKILFTDLDGTLLSLNNYSFQQSLSAIEDLKAAGIPVIFCSSKTRAEQEYYQQALGLNEPFIVENGSGIFMPRGYFHKPIAWNTYVTERYEVIPFGKSISHVRKAIRSKRAEQALDFVVYADLPVKKVADLTGLNEEGSVRAMQRDFSETILKGEVNSRFLEQLDVEGYHNIPGSKFQTIVSKTADKGRAVNVLSALYKADFGEILTYGLGDSKNDEAMLAAVDHPYLVQRPDNSWIDLDVVQAKGLMGVGPEGFSKLVEQILE